MKYFKSSQSNIHEENIFWASLSDLMLGLLIVFIVLFLLAVSGLTKQEMEKQSVKSKIVSELEGKFAVAKMPIEIDKLTGDIKISDLELFQINDYQLSEKGKAYLDKFVPIYFDTVLADKDVRDSIDKILIEGHTDSQTYYGIKDENENYIKNLDLSMKRAYAVSQYIMQMDFKNNTAYKTYLAKLLSTNGRSYSEPILVDGKEDYAKSRRVELSFTLKEFNYIDLIKTIHEGN